MIISILFDFAAGLYGANSQDALVIDMVCELCNDFVGPKVSRMGVKDAKEKVTKIL